MVSVQLPEPVAPDEEELGRRKPEIVHWFYYMPCAGVKCYAYEESPAPIKTTGPGEASPEKDRVG